MLRCCAILVSVVTPVRVKAPRLAARLAVAIIALGAVVAAPATSFADDSSPTTEQPAATRVSIWDRPVADGDQTYWDLTLNGAEQPAEPILLPLPAPAVAAAVGLGVVWVIRRRFGSRSDA